MSIKSEQSPHAARAAKIEELKRPARAGKAQTILIFKRRKPNSRSKHPN